MAEADFRIVKGNVYTYKGGLPPACRGHAYRVLDFVTAVPEYYTKVLVEAISGPDQGLLFVCSPWNFSTRYDPVPEPQPAKTSVKFSAIVE